jgi:hypothetical protein
MVVATCSPQARNITRNTHNMSGRREGAQHGKSVRNMVKGVRNMEKVFATRCLDIGRNMLATSSQQVRHKLATCTLCQGRRDGGATWRRCLQHVKSVRNMGKGVRNMEKVFTTWEKGVRNTLRNIMIR